MMNKRIDSALGLISILLTGFFSFTNFHEWYNVSIMQNVDDYPFGTEGPSPYYYQAASLYATVMFTWGSVFLANMLFILWTMLKGQRKATMIGVLFSMVLLLIMFIHGQIGKD